MKINVRIKPRSSRNKVEKTDSGYAVYVTEPPVENRANVAMIENLSEYFSIPKSKIRIVAGFKSRNKIIELSE